MRDDRELEAFIRSHLSTSYHGSSSCRMGADDARLQTALDALVAEGHPEFLTYVTTPFNQPTATEQHYRKMFAGLTPGLHFGAFHFTRPGDMEFFSPDIKLRTTEYELFRSGTARRLLDEAGIELAGLRGYRDQMRRHE